MAAKKERIQLDPKTKAVFDRKGYIVLDKISQGAFGHVYKAKKTSDGTMSAVKVMEIAKMPEKFVKEFLPRELDMLQKIKHPNVLNVFDIFRSKGKYWIFMEFAPNGVLTSRCDGKPIPERKAKKWFHQCANALNYMHNDIKVCHRDIKTDNVLLDKNDNAKLSDFGFAKVLEDSNHGITNTHCGTSTYESPELMLCMYKKTPYNAFAADCWAMGVMLYVMLTSNFPFRPLPFKHPDDCRIMIGWMNDRTYQERKEFQDLPEGAQYLINHLLEPNQDKRYNTRKMLRHKWVLDS